MPPISRVERAYDRGGAKEVFRGAFRLGMGKLINVSGVSVDENKVLRSEDILEGTTRVSEYHELPAKEDLTPLRRSESGNPFDEAKSEAEILQPCQYSYRPDFVCEIENVRLLGPKGIGITGDGVILEDSITMPGRGRIEPSIRGSYIHYPLLTFETVHTSSRSSLRASRTIGRACSLYSPWNNYYHWVLEHLPKLRAVEYYEETTGTQLTLIIPNDPPSYIRETLELLDIKPSDCLEWKPPAIDVRDLVLPSYPEANPENLRWLRTNLRGRIQMQRSERSPDRIYVSRRKAPKRRIENEAQLSDLLRDFGFERVYAEDLSVRDQIRLFSNADTIIGPHGAGLTNMIWGDEMTVFEIHNDHVRDYYSVLANNLAHDYIPIQGDSIEPTRLDSNMIVDVEQAEAVLADEIDR